MFLIIEREAGIVAGKSRPLHVSLIFDDVHRKQMMNALPFRTNSTEMTQDELLIADCLARDVGAYLSDLRQERYGTHMNVRYTHGIPDDALKSELDNLVKRGWLVLLPKDVRGHRAYTLTKIGGNLWEAERTPIWELYCSVAFIGFVGDQEQRGCIVAYDRDIGEQCIRVVHEVGFMVRTHPEVMPQWERDTGVRYWNDNDVAWKCEFDIEKQDDSGWNRWNEIEAKRTWWDTLKELQKFLPNRTGNLS